jgi:hypothetical protein
LATYNKYDLINATLQIANPNAAEFGTLLGTTQEGIDI